MKVNGVNFKNNIHQNVNFKGHMRVNGCSQDIIKIKNLFSENYEKDALINDEFVSQYSAIEKIVNEGDIRALFVDGDDDVDKLLDLKTLLSSTFGSRYNSRYFEVLNMYTDSHFSKNTGKVYKAEDVLEVLGTGIYKVDDVKKALKEK